MITFDMNNQNFHEIKSMHLTHRVLLKAITGTDMVVSGMEVKQQTSQSLSV